MNEVYDALYEVCDFVHADCNGQCPVFAKHGFVPDSAKNFEINRGCDCFKNGRAMFKYLAGFDL